MLEVPYTNRTKATVHIGNKSLLPGETRTVNAMLIPKKKPVFDAVAFLDRAIKLIEPELETLTEDELQELLLAEEAGEDRSTLIKEISALIVQREEEAELILFAENIADCTPDQLQEMLLEHKDDDAKSDIIKAALANS